MRSLVACLLTLMAAPVASFAKPGEVRAFAVIVGSNASVDRSLKTLRYADDDAFRFAELFDTVGAQTVLLARPDENTARVHAERVPRALPPTDRSLDQAIEQVAASVRDARRLGFRTRLHFVFAGHGNARGGSAYLTLEDARIDGEQLRRRVVERIAADETHLIIDACHATFLAYGRGPGGSSRAVAGFVAEASLASSGTVGLLLASTVTGETHEWEAFQAGVFSHEVRSGLYGAADVDGDGAVSYREIAAFVSRANEAIPNEKYRPAVVARPPASTPVLLEWRTVDQSRSATVELDGTGGEAHHLIEDERGVRLVDFHSARKQPLRIRIPRPRQQTFVRRLSDDREFIVGASDRALLLTEGAGRPASTTTRGAAHEAFSLLFRLPFDRAAADLFTLSTTASEPPRVLPWRGAIGGATMLAAAGLGAFAARAWYDTRELSSTAGAAPSQSEVAQKNLRIEQGNRRARNYGLAAAALMTAGVVVFFWPQSEGTEMALAPNGVTATMRW